MQAIELFVVQVEQFQALAAARIVDARADRAHVEGIRLQRFHQRQVVELGVVGQRHHGAARIEARFDDEVVGHRMHQVDAGYVPVGAVFLARVADDDAVIHAAGYLRQEARQGAGADDEQAPARAVERVQRFAFDAQHGARSGGRERHRAAVQVDAAFQQFAAFEPVQQFADAAGGRQGFDRQLDGAAAGQAEAVGVVGADAVADDVRHGVRGDTLGAHVLDQVVLDAAAGDRADHAAIVAHGEGGADGARARAPGLDHRDQFAAVARGDPAGGGFQYVEVEAIHGSGGWRCWVRNDNHTKKARVMSAGRMGAAGLSFGGASEAMAARPEHGQHGANVRVGSGAG